MNSLVTLAVLLSLTFCYTHGRNLQSGIVTCANVFQATQACDFRSERFPEAFPPDTVCSYTVYNNVQSQPLIRLNFATITLAEGDEISLYQGEDDKSPLIAKIDSTIAASNSFTYVSATGVITLVMKSSSIVADRMFDVLCIRSTNVFTMPSGNVGRISSNEKFDISEAIYLSYVSEFVLNPTSGNSINVTGIYTVDNSIADCSDDSVQFVSGGNVIDTKCGGENVQLAATYNAKSMSIRMRLDKPNTVANPKNQEINFDYAFFDAPTTVPPTTTEPTTLETTTTTTITPPVQTTTSQVVDTTKIQSSTETTTTVQLSTTTTTRNPDETISVEVYVGLWTGAIVDVYLDGVKVNHSPLPINKTKHFAAQPGQTVLVVSLTGGGICQVTLAKCNTHIDVFGNIGSFNCPAKPI